MLSLPRRRASEGSGEGPGGAQQFKYVFRRDLPDDRKWTILADYSDREAAIRDFPDFTTAYMRAAYPNHAEDHENANIEFLHMAIGKVRQESRIHAKLGCYAMWSGDYELGFRRSVQCLIMDPEKHFEPGDRLCCDALVRGVLAANGYEMPRLATGADMGPREEEIVEKATDALSDPKYRDLAKEAVRALRKAGVSIS